MSIPETESDKSNINGFDDVNIKLFVFIPSDSLFALHLSSIIL